MIACNCKGIPEGKLREALKEADGPVRPKDMHDQLGGDKENCCGGCRTPKGDRLFVDIINEHNEKFVPPAPK